VRDQQAARLVLHQLGLQCFLPLDVEMVGRLIKQVEVRRRQPQHQHAKPRFLAAGQPADWIDLHIDADPDARQQAAGAMLANLQGANRTALTRWIGS